MATPNDEFNTLISVFHPTVVFSPYSAENPSPFPAEVEFLVPDAAAPLPIPGGMFVAGGKQERVYTTLNHLWGVLYGTYPKGLVDVFQRNIATESLYGYTRLAVRPAAALKQLFFFEWEVRNYELPNGALSRLGIPGHKGLQEAAREGRLFVELKDAASVEVEGAGWLSGPWSFVWHPTSNNSNNSNNNGGDSGQDQTQQQTPNAGNIYAADGSIDEEVMRGLLLRALGATQ
ncbi:hypothetical protein BJ508DRAFT_330484 [Ascobolus immersus RN42]|uniref:Uncharacterized protein n=1 Tax=Ascobolus immersus RN42 TaxID=1160509 RepID=A0A3N4HVR0_ASCIM|nr:hypothetical protein BJ508DRAFT_330484 [Ascobolus immersus RN42]